MLTALANQRFFRNITHNMSMNYLLSFVNAVLYYTL